MSQTPIVQAPESEVRLARSTRDNLAQLTPQSVAHIVQPRAEPKFLDLVREADAEFEQADFESALADVLSLQGASQQRAWRMKGYPRVHSGNPFEWQGEWASDWLPIVSRDAYCLFVDCTATTPAGTIPVRRYDQMPEDVFTPCAVSVTQMVDIWVYVLEERYFWWSDEERGWLDRWAELPTYIKIEGPF